jgi:hypothetical protein
MIVKILGAARNFPGVKYNTDKVDRNNGELMMVANFGSLHGMTDLRPQDYINYLQMISALNSRVEKPQFHAVISAKGKSYDKDALSRIAADWLNDMGYGSQPYLVVFHKDTLNNHVHLVTTRVDKAGKKIDSAFEKIRAIRSLNKVLGYDAGMEYKFSTSAQFYTVLETMGLPGKDFDERKLRDKIATYLPDKERMDELKKLFIAHKGDPNFRSILKEKHRIDLVFHSAEGKLPYGYTIVDHAAKQVFKGSEIMALRNLANSAPGVALGPEKDYYPPEFASGPIYVPSVFIAGDIDDELVLGRNRRRKRQSPTLTR